MAAVFGTTQMRKVIFAEIAKTALAPTAIGQGLMKKGGKNKALGSRELSFYLTVNL